MKRNSVYWGATGLVAIVALLGGFSYVTNTAGTVGAIRATVDAFEPRVPIPPDAWGPTDAFGFRYAVAMISTSQPAFPHWKRPVQVTIRNRNGHLDVVGIDRQTELPDAADSERRARK